MDKSKSQRSSNSIEPKNSDPTERNNQDIQSIINSKGEEDKGEEERKDRGKFTGF